MRLWRRPTEAGFALITVLWAVLILALIAASISLAARTEIKLATARRTQAELRATADGAINLVILHLLRAPRTEWPSLDGTSFPVQVGERTVQASVRSELGKIDLNTASVDLLEKLFIIAGRVPDAARVLAQRIADWRGQVAGGRSAEDIAAEYRAAGLAHMPSGRPFASIEELQLLLGLSPELFQRIAPLITVHAQTGTVATQYAAPEVLLVLTGGDTAEVASIREASAGRAEDARRARAAAAGAAGQSLVGQALTITAIATREAESRVKRRAIIRITGHTREPFWVYRWE